MIKLVSPNFKDLLEPNIDIRQFPDGESYIRIPQLAQCKDQEVTVYHRLYPDQDRSLVQLLFILRELQQVNAKVTVVAPYLAYSRQDKPHLDGEATSAAIVCNLLAQNGCQQLVTLDCHFLNKEGEQEYSGLNINNLSMHQELLDYATKYFNDEPFLTVSPDQGASYMVAAHQGQALQKSRGTYRKGEIVQRDIENLTGDINFKDQNVLFLDDMIVTGSTMIKAATLARQQGAKKIICGATHGLFIGDSRQKLQQVADQVFVTDSIPDPLAVISIKNKLP